MSRRTDDRRPAVLAAARELDARGVYPSIMAVAHAARVRKDLAERHLRSARESGELVLVTPKSLGGRPGGYVALRRDRESELRTAPPDIEERIEHYRARLKKGWPLFRCSPFAANLRENYR